MADRLSYNQILENKKFIDNLLNNEELDIDDKEELEYVWQSLVSREESKFDAIISVIKDCDKQISSREPNYFSCNRRAWLFKDSPHFFPCSAKVQIFELVNLEKVILSYLIIVVFLCFLLNFLFGICFIIWKEPGLSL